MQDNNEAFTLGVELIEEHEDGGATYGFHMDERTRDAMSKIGLELVVICGAYGVDLQDALDAARGAKEAAELMEGAADKLGALRASVRALLAQLDGQPVKHPQQSAERDAARALIGGAA